MLGESEDIQRFNICKDDVAIRSRLFHKDFMELDDCIIHARQIRVLRKWLDDRCGEYGHHDQPEIRIDRIKANVE